MWMKVFSVGNPRGKREWVFELVVRGDKNYLKPFSGGMARNDRAGLNHDTESGVRQYAVQRRHEGIHFTANIHFFHCCSCNYHTVTYTHP